MSETYLALVALFTSDPSEALYRAEEELTHAEFMAFIAYAASSTS